MIKKKDFIVVVGILLNELQSHLRPSGSRCRQNRKEDRDRNRLRGMCICRRVRTQMFSERTDDCTKSPSPCFHIHIALAS